MPPQREKPPPYLWFDVTNLLKAEMEANCQEILRELGGGDGSIVEIKGYARLLYLGALSCGANAIDYFDEAGKEAAIRTQMKVCCEQNCSRAAYCDVPRFFMTNRRGHMSNFLKYARKKLESKNEEAQHNGVRDADGEVSAEVCSGLKLYVSNRCIGRGRKTNQQRRKTGVACGYLFNDSQLKIKGFVKWAMQVTGFS